MVSDSAGVVSSVTDPVGGVLVGDSVAAVFLVGVLAAAVLLVGARFGGAPTGSSGAPVVGPSIGAGFVGSLIRHAPRDRRHGLASCAPMVPHRETRLRSVAVQSGSGDGTTGSGPDQRRSAIGRSVKG